MFEVYLLLELLLEALEYIIRDAPRRCIPIIAYLRLIYPKWDFALGRDLSF